MELLKGFNNKFYIDKSARKKYIVYCNFEKRTSNYYNGHIGEEIIEYNTVLVKKEFTLGEQICNFINTDFESIESFKEFVIKYGFTMFINLSMYKVDTTLEVQEYDNLLEKFIKKYKYLLQEYRQNIKNDIEYIYNMNNLEELNSLTPMQRFFVLANSDKQAYILKAFDNNKTKITFSAFEWINHIPFATREDKTQEIAPKVNINSPYYIECTDIIQNLIIELAELSCTNNIEIKKCKNCGKFFVPENRSDEIYCSNIFENGKTCKEIGHFKVLQKEMKQNDDLRIYRNVYQKLLLRTRRNPNNTEYARDFELFKYHNNELKEKVSNGQMTQEEYMKWLNEQ